MKITLIQCPAWTTDSPPYSLALLQAVLKRSGYDVVCFDLNIELYRFCQETVRQKDSPINNESWSIDFKGSVWYEKDNVLTFINRYEYYIDRLVKDIIDASERIIGFSVQSTSKFFSLEVARRIKEKDKNKIIIFGGPLCFRNCYGMDILEHYPFLDFVCLGEAEKSFPDLINSIEKNDYIDTCIGFKYRQDNRSIDRGDAGLIEDLDEIPFADYSGFIFKKYTKNLLPISTSRGCINRCTFCNESPHWKKYRKRSAKNIFGEINYQLKKYPHIESFWFNDSLMNGDLEMLNEFCNLLISNKTRIKWGGQGMIRKEMTNGLLKKMRLAGCNLISYGIENGSSRILKLMQKGYTPELAQKVLRDTYKAGIDTVFNIIIGFPGEEESEFKETKKFILHCRNFTNNIALNLCLLMKGSYLYDNLSKFNITPIEYSDPDWQLKWKTNDSRNVYEIRKTRMEELMKLTKKKTFYAYS